MSEPWPRHRCDAIITPTTTTTTTDNAWANASFTAASAGTAEPVACTSTITTIPSIPVLDPSSILICCDYLSRRDQQTRTPQKHLMHHGKQRCLLRLLVQPAVWLHHPPVTRPPLLLPHFLVQLHVHPRTHMRFYLKMMLTVPHCPHPNYCGQRPGSLVIPDPAVRKLVPHIPLCPLLITHMHK